MWPANAFATGAGDGEDGADRCCGALLGAYQTAAASGSMPDYRILYASLGASLGQQIGPCPALVGAGGRRAVPRRHRPRDREPALEPYLG